MREKTETERIGGKADPPLLDARNETQKQTLTLAEKEKKEKKRKKKKEKKQMPFRKLFLGINANRGMEYHGCTESK
jgi:hypothetical protein